MKKKLFLIPLALLLAISLVAIGCPKTTPTTTLPTTPTTTPTTTSPAPKTLKIGAIHSLTGPGSEGEILMRDGAVLCQEWINEKGGITINGEKYLIELIVEDQKGNVDGAVAAATKLVEQDKVKFIIGQVVPDVCIAVASVTEPAKVLRSLCWGGGIPPVMNPDTPYTFRPVLSGAEMIPVNYDYLVETYPNVKTIALLSPDEPGGQFFIMVSRAEAEAHGLTVVAEEFHLFGAEDYYPVWTKILAAKPDAVDAGTEFPLPAALILKQGRELGFTGPIFSLSPCELYTLLDIAGKDLCYDYFNSSLDIQSPDVPPMIREMQARWEAKFGTPYMFESFQGWDALWCLTQAIEAAQSLDPTEVAATWEKMESIETCYGTGHMGGLQTYGINHLVVRPCPVSRLENGEVELIKWYLPEFP